MALPALPYCPIEAAQSQALQPKYYQYKNK